MASGTIQGKKIGSYGVWLAWTGDSDVETNTTKFTLKTYVSHPKINISARTGSTIIDGSTASYKTGAHDSGADDAWLVNTRVKTILHEDDGTKTINVSASFPFKLNSSSHGEIGTLKASGECVLDDIPRASAVSTQSGSVTVNGSNKWTLTVAKHSTAFWHKATLSIGGKTYTTSAFDVSADYVIPQSWLEEIPDSKTGDVTVSIQTYSDQTCETAIGDPVYTSFKISVPDTAGPVIDDGWVTISPYNTGSAAEGMTGYIQGYSKVMGVFDSTKVTAQYGATITDVQLWHKRVKYASPFLTNVLTISGVQSVECVAVDSRGMKTSYKTSINVQPYVEPTLTGVSIYRCNSNGAADDLGTFLYFAATAGISSCGGENTAVLTAAYKPVVNSVWTNSTSIASGEASVLGAGAISTTTSYDARITVQDRLGNKTDFSALISTADAALHIKQGGRGAAFGKYAEEDDLLDCDWRLRARGGIYGISLYSHAEAEHGVWVDGEKLYMRVLTGEISAGTSAIGSIEGFGQLIAAYGTAGNAALTGVSVDASGGVQVTSPVGGTANAIVIYKKE